MKIKVKPAVGVKVRDPLTMQHLPDEGKEVVASTYWVRRIKCGDVIDVTNVEGSAKPSVENKESKKK